MFLIVKVLKPQHNPGLDNVREVTKSVLRVCVKEVNQYVERKSWEEEITLRGLIKPIQFTAFQ